MDKSEKFPNFPLPLDSPDYDKYRSCWPTRDYIPRRFSVSIVVFLGAWVVMILRVFISVTLTGDNGMQDEYNWSDVEKGFILSSFYWGYIIPQIFSGWLAVKYGGRHVFGFGTLFSIIFSTLTPLTAGTYPLLLLCRVCCGFAEGFCIPSMFTFAARWIPPEERSRTLSFFAGASYFGTAFAFAVTPALMELVGWRNVFYVYGILGGLWYVLWLLFGWSNPEEHPNCPKLEKEYIRECLSVDSAVQQKLLTSPTPWRALFTAAPIWAPIVGHFSFNWAYYTLVSFLPEYFYEVLGFDVSGSYNQVLPYILMFLMAQLSGRIVEVLTRPSSKTGEGYMVLLNARRFVVSFGFLVPAVVLCGIVYVNKTLAVMFFTISVGFTGLTASGYFSNFGDVAPFHSGVVVGVSNTLATIPGIVSPIVSGYILDAGGCISDTDDGTVQPDSCTTSWQIIFAISSIVFVFGWVVFSYFAKAVMIVDDNGKRTDLYLTPQQRLSVGDGLPYHILDDSYLKSAQPRLSKDDGPFIQ